MKTTVINNNCTKESQFPCLMLSHDKKIIILATSGDIGPFKNFSILSGVVIHSDDASYPIGNYREDWIRFSEFDGKVVLEN
ncbi:MAG TPA: hypothetical protein VFM18_07205 [Methanosarcina sp.]|nr:hypothetical protein [Methanosarcina sp.]